MNLYIQHKIREEQPKESDWYPTDRGLLYYFKEEKEWSCRDDKLSVEYPWVWYEELESERIIYKPSIT